MRTLMISTSDLAGGAARGAYRLHKGLQGIGVDSQMLVRYKTGDDPTVIKPSGKFEQALSKVYTHLDLAPLQLYPKRQHLPWGVGWYPNGIERKVNQIKPDIVHLHWISIFVPIHALSRIAGPIVWTLHDMWPFTGGCHYDQECGRYRQACGICPELASNCAHDLSHWIWKRKQQAWRKLNLTIVAQSHWLAECARASSLFRDFRIETFYHGLDLAVFRPIDKHLARDLLSLPQDRRLILFGAAWSDRTTSITDLRKGFQFVEPCIQQLIAKGWKDRADLVVFGAGKPADAADLGLRVHFLGHLHDDVSLALVYSAADVLVAPSTQENLSAVVTEALACGTPCVAFRVGGMPDLIEHTRTGCLARPFEVDDLVEQVLWVLEDDDRRKYLCHEARAKVEREFEISLAAKRYEALYQELIGIKHNRTFAQSGA